MKVLMICPELPHDKRPGTMAPTRRQFQSLESVGVEIETVDIRGVPILKYFALMPKVRKFARQNDIIHTHFGFAGWLAKIATLGMRPRKPIMISFMGMGDLLHTPRNASGKIGFNSYWVTGVNKWIAKKFVRVIVKSQEMADVIPHVKCDVIPNGVDLNSFVPSDRVEACKALGVSPTGYTVFFPGNPTNLTKGYPLAMEAVGLAEKQLGESIQVLKLGGVPPEKVPIYMNASHAMLMTSFIEGSPNVVKEAMASNLPTVGVPVGDVHWLLGGVANCHCTSRDVQEIANALVAILKSGQRSNGREIIVQRGLDLESVAKRVKGIYEEILSRNS